MYNVNTYPHEGNSSMPSGKLRHTDGGSDGGVGGRGGYRWIEDIAVKGVSAFALAYGDPRRLTESRKMARSKISPAHNETHTSSKDTFMHSKQYCRLLSSTFHFKDIKPQVQRS